MNPARNKLFHLPAQALPFQPAAAPPPDRRWREFWGRRCKLRRQFLNVELSFRRHVVPSILVVACKGVLAQLVFANNILDHINAQPWAFWRINPAILMRKGVADH